MAVELLSFYIPCNSYASPLFNTGVYGIISLYQKMRAGIKNLDIFTLKVILLKYLWEHFKAFMPYP